MDQRPPFPPVVRHHIPLPLTGIEDILRSPNKTGGERGKRMDDCLFCKIVEGDIDTEKVYQDEQMVAFKDINPMAPTHILIVPRRHIATLNDINEEDASLLGGMIHRAARLAGEMSLAEEGYRLVFNCMPGAGQSVFHIHLHLLGGRIFRWPPG